MTGFLCLLLVQAAGSPGEPPTWGKLRSGNPPGREFSLHLPGARRYRQGELIRAEVRFPARSLASPDEPPREFWRFSGLLLDPPQVCGSLADPCHRMMAGEFDKSDPLLGFGHAAGPFPATLNYYLPRLSPGRYRIAALARRYVAGATGPQPPGYAASNTVEIEISAATPEWERQAVAASTAVLGGPEPATQEAHRARRAAAEQLRFLDTPDSWDSSLRFLGVHEGLLLRGLAATRAPARVCALMRAAVPAPSQAVSLYYLFTIGEICERAHGPDIERSELLAEDAAALAASIGEKRGEAKAAAFEALIRYVTWARGSDPLRPEPGWIAAVKTEFARSRPQFDGWRARQLLSMYAGALRSPDMVPLLESALDAWKPGDYYEAPREALRRLNAIDPLRARARIRAELERERTWLDWTDLELLPRSAALIPDDTLIAALAAAQRPGGWNPQLRMAALARYGSPRALRRVRAIFESQQDPCQPELMAYFLRVDPAYSERVFQAHPWNMNGTPPPCAVPYFERTPAIAMGPPLERYMAAYLMHEQVQVKTAAARSLGRYGSPAAVAALWDALCYFHGYWKDRPAELARNREGVLLELELRNAIARGRNWLAREADLRIIESLCLSTVCIAETRNDLGHWQGPLPLEIGWGDPGFQGRVAHYFGLPSIEAVEAKLARFPKGTRFVLRFRGVEPEGVRARLLEFAGVRGLVVTPAPAPRAARGRGR